jgi:hypothetical protein
MANQWIDRMDKRDKFGATTYITILILTLITVTLMVCVCVGGGGGVWRVEEVGWR